MYERTMMKRTEFSVPKMDCPSEEGLIRIAFEKVEGIHKLSFDLSARRLTVFHSSSPDILLESLVPLNFGAEILETYSVSENEEVLALAEKGQPEVEAKVLKQLIAINGFMFVAEIIIGLLAQSTGLIADSLDMFADAAVYGLSLYAVGRDIIHKRRAARYSGYLQLLLALGVFAEIIRRLIFGSEPQASFMMGMAFIALLANLTCMLLLAKHRDGEVHMKASWIFTTNDVLANVGVIVAGILVQYTSSSIPDLVIGTVIGSLVLAGALRILKVARA